MNWRIEVAVQTPVHSALGDLLSYASAVPPRIGNLVRVPLGRREVLGVVWAVEPLTEGPVTGIELKPISAVLDALDPLADGWRDLVGFAARYYQRSLGEIALAALPPSLREMSSLQLTRRLKRQKPITALQPTGVQRPPVALTNEQAGALAAIDAEAGPFVLFGSTGSGKTEVYLRSVSALFQRDPTAQVLVMVPEINLTPQLESQFEERFADALGAGAVVSLHSGMTNPQRLASWTCAAQWRGAHCLGYPHGRVRVDAEVASDRGRRRA